ncbi:MAG TPA: glutathione S-transferase N-terminal domain-containing protein [Gaiellaceae bacterium]
MLELWQTEWCPASRRIRERLTELGIDYVTRQVPVDKEQRVALRQQTGSDTIPALVLENGTVTMGEEAIRRYLDDQIAEPPEAEAHRLKAAKARRRYLEEECECSQRPTH